MRWGRQPGLLKDLECARPLGDLDRLVGGKIAEGLGRVAGRPGDRQLGHTSHIAQLNRVDEATPSEAGIVADCARLGHSLDTNRHSSSRHRARHTAGFATRHTSSRSATCRNLSRLAAKNRPGHWPSLSFSSRTCRPSALLPSRSEMRANYAELMTFPLRKGSPLINPEAGLMEWTC